MLNPIILSIPLVIPLMMPPPADCQFGRLGDTAADDAAIVAFQVAIDDYVELHRRLERAWPPAWFFADPEADEYAGDTLRAALIDARPHGAPGGMFTPAIADVLRFRIARALRSGEYERRLMTWPPEGYEDAGRWKPQVNQPIPWGVAASRWPSFAMLPPLPPELAYRFIGRDLVLVDRHANLVIDILDLALPTAASPVREAPVPPSEDFEGCGPE